MRSVCNLNNFHKIINKQAIILIDFRVSFCLKGHLEDKNSGNETLMTFRLFETLICSNMTNLSATDR